MHDDIPPALQTRYCDADGGRHNGEDVARGRGGAGAAEGAQRRGRRRPSVVGSITGIRAGATWRRPRRIGGGSGYGIAVAVVVTISSPPSRCVTAIGTVGTHRLRGQGVKGRLARSNKSRVGGRVSKLH